MKLAVYELSRCYFYRPDYIQLPEIVQIASPFKGEYIMSKQAIINILNKTNISAWARNYWSNVLRQLKSLTYSSSGEDKIVSPLRKAMSELDYALPDYIFDHKEGHKIKDCIDKVWEEIDEVEGLNADWDQAEEWLKDDNWGHIR